METIILISVLSTLGVVALVSSIVVAFMRLGKKVDVQNLEETTDYLIDDITKLREDVYNTIKNEVTRLDEQRAMEWEDGDKRFEDVYRALEKLESNLDSRADKLHSLIQEVKSSIAEPIPQTNN